MALIHSCTLNSHWRDRTSADKHLTGKDREVSWSDACFSVSCIYDSNKIRNKVKLQPKVEFMWYIIRVLFCFTVQCVNVLLFQSIRARGRVVLWWWSSQWCLPVSHSTPATPSSFAVGSYPGWSGWLPCDIWCGWDTSYTMVSSTISYRCVGKISVWWD